MLASLRLGEGSENHVQAIQDIQVSSLLHHTTFDTGDALQRPQTLCLGCSPLN